MDPRTNMSLRNALVGIVIGSGLGIVFAAIADSTAFIGFGPAAGVATALPLAQPPQRLLYVVLAVSFTALVALSIIYFFFFR